MHRRLELSVSDAAKSTGAASRDFIVDTTPPDTTINSGPTRTVKVKPKKPGKFKASFKVTYDDSGGKTVKKKITVRE